MEVQWLKIRLAMQGTLVWSLVGELRSHMPRVQLLSPRALEPTCRSERSRVPQQRPPCTKGGKPRWGGDGGVLNWAIGIDMYTLMCIKLMTNKNLQYKQTNKKNN